MPRRQVSVSLELDAHDYLAESAEIIGVTRAVKASIHDLGDESEETGRDLDKLAAEADLAKHEVDDLGDKARSTTVQMDGLDKRIKAAKASVGSLALEFAKTGDLATKQDLSDAKRALAVLEKTRRDILAFAGSDTASRAAALASAGVADTVSKGLFAGLKGFDFRGAFMKYLIGGLVAVSPAIGAIVGGAVVGVTGLGGLAGGVLSAIHQPAVKFAFSQFAASISDTFFNSASSTAFVRPILASLELLKRGFKDLDLGGSFALAAPSLTILTQGIIDLVKNAMPGFNQVMGASGPIMKAMADGLARIGTGLSNFFKSLLSSPGTIEGLKDGLHLIAWAIEGIGRVLHFLGNLYDLIKNLGGPAIQALVKWWGLLSDAIGASVEGLDMAYHRMKDGAPTAVLINSSKNAMIATQGLTSATYNLAEAHKYAMSQTDLFRMSVDSLNASLDAEINRNLSLWSATLAANQAIADATQTIKDNGRAWDQNSDAARNNQRAIKDGIEAIKQQKDAAIANSDGSTAAIKAINEKYNEELNILLKLAGQAGATKAELDKLAGTYTVKVNTILTGVGSDDRAQDQAHQHTLTPSRRAAGGSVLGGRTYRVAEQRPEMFVGSQTWTAPGPGWVGPLTSMSAFGAAPTGSGDRTITVIVKDTSGRTLRTELIRDAENRGKAKAQISVAYP